MPTKLIRKQFLLSREENEQVEERAAAKQMSVSNLTRKFYGLQPLKPGGKREKRKTSPEEIKPTHQPP